MPSVQRGDGAVQGAGARAPAPAGTGTSTSTGASTGTGTGTATGTDSASASATVPSASTSLAHSLVPSTVAPGACRVVRGPIEMPVRSPVTLVLRGDTLDVVLDEDGKPRVVALSAAALPAAPVSSATAAGAASAAPAREPAEGGSVAGISVPCAAAGEHFFCPDRAGGVHRVSRAGGDDHVVASSRTGTRVGAAPLGTHAAVAYVASRKTTEGWMSEGWLAVDDEPPVRISEDGSGATSLGLVPRGASLLAFSVDARSALTALHVRPIAYERGLKLGEDSVVFVAGPGDRRTGAALVASEHGASWALLPIAKDVGTFGLAIVKVDDPPHVDEPVVWSPYPNGLDPAPVAGASIGGRTWVARVRPQGSEPSSPRVLELGDIGADGSFTARDLVPSAASPADASLVADAHGGLWVAWLDATGAWVERLACTV
jgi:hypothetical protein